VRLFGDDVGEEDVMRVKSCASDHAIEFGSAAADEGHLLAKLLGTPRLSDEHDRRLWAPASAVPEIDVLLVKRMQIIQHQFLSVR